MPSECEADEVVFSSCKTIFVPKAKSPSGGENFRGKLPLSAAADTSLKEGGKEKKKKAPSPRELSAKLTEGVYDLFSWATSWSAP